MQFKYDVSVITGVLNNEKYIKECLDSIINQDYDLSKIEHIIVNDGSEDTTLEILKEYEKKYDHIKIKDNGKNLGISKSRNIAMDIAKGKYILILDSDDYLSSKSISKLVEFFDSNYEEIDLVTYPIYTVKNSVFLHPRYKSYLENEDISIYNINEYPYLNQSTVNIMIKNKKDIRFNENMKLSEDQNLCTEIIMKKQRIGFCKDAVYYYRRTGVGVSSTSNNMVYCFDDIMFYNESLIKRYAIKGILHPYVQSLIIHTFQWRLKSDMLFPYHLEGKEYEKGFNRILNILKSIDIEVIKNMPDISDNYKVYWLKLKKINLDIKANKDGIKLYADDTVVIESEIFDIQINRYKIIKDELYIKGIIDTPIFEFIKPDLYIELNYSSRKKEEKLELYESKLCYYYCKTKTNVIYAFETRISLSDLKKFDFCFKIRNEKYKTVFKTNEILNSNIYGKKYIIEIKDSDCFIRKSNIKNKLSYNIVTLVKNLVKRPKAEMYRVCSKLYKTNKKIWLYSDASGVMDNGFLQFKHDIKKQDGIKRYYVYEEGDSKIFSQLNEKEKKQLICFRSFKHKMLYINCNMLITSFSEKVSYCPFNNSIKLYKDLTNYDLIYLQHGILHANLLNMYGKEFNEIDKIVISSEFEKRNLINNYGYNESDLLLTGMPRLDEVKEKVEIENKIIYAPSWRSYLIGEIIKAKRNTNYSKFMSSTLYKEINKLINSDRLKEILEKNDLKLDIKLHPNFKVYKECFKINNKNINVDFEKTILGKYKIFITDFSSFQFDFIPFVRPVIYWIPDIKEFKSGLHTYKELDLKQEDAFGNNVNSIEELVNEIDKITKNGYMPEEKYIKRMKTFFKISGSCQEKLYKELEKINKHQV